MPNPTPSQILALCDSWCAAVSIGNGSLVIGGNSDKYRLLANGVQFHELDHASLCASLLGLTKVLLLPGLNTVISFDHYALWAWCGEVFLNPQSRLFGHDQHEIYSLYKTSIHAALANCRKPCTKEEFLAQVRIADAQPHHAKSLLQESSRVLAYLAFPLLEAILKRACASFVAPDGEVVSAFSISTRDGGTKTYDPTGRFRRCNSLCDLLVLHHMQVAQPALVKFLNAFSAHIRGLQGTMEAYDTVYHWRNQSLHGTTNFWTIGGTLLNLSLALTLFEIAVDFDERRQRALLELQWAASSSSRSPLSFYPPY